MDTAVGWVGGRDGLVSSRKDWLERGEKDPGSSWDRDSSQTESVANKALGEEMADQEAGFSIRGKLAQPGAAKKANSRRSNPKIKA